MRVLALHPDVIVVVSSVWQTTCTAVRADDEGFVIDSPVYPDELDALPAVLERAGFPVSGLLATHGDWDHVLGRLAFPDASLGVGEPTASRLRSEPGEAQRELRRFDQQHYVERPHALGLGAVQELPVPGHLALGARELKLQLADGHTADGTAVWIPWTSTLVVGDYLSPCEIPMISDGGSPGAYLSTLARLRALLERAEHVVPGHGVPISGADAMRILDEDARYLEELRENGESAPLPRGRASETQRRIHADNVQRSQPGR